jgi:1-acyl-sn-glycerol-3-phosphate acyltransferase
MAKKAPITKEQIEQNKYIYYELFNSHYADGLVKNLIDHIDTYYFRTRYIGFDDYPQRNKEGQPLLFVSNHSGMAFPWDAILFTAGLYRLNNYEMKNAVRTLTAPMLSKSNLMNPFLVPDFWKKAGGIDATFLNFETMMHYKESNLMMYPEGVPGIGKGFPKRYQLQRFATSFIRISIKYKADVIPVATVNGEYINPYAFKSEPLNKLSQKLGIPFLPIGIMTLLIPFQPWLFYFGFPAKLVYVKGKRIKPYKMIDKPYEEITDEEFREIADKVKEQMQAELTAAVEKYGKVHYKYGELFSLWVKNLKKFPYFLPCCWASIFTEYDSRFKLKGKIETFKLRLSSIITIIKHNPIIIAFFIPILGWIPILMRGMKRPK